MSYFFIVAILLYIISIACEVSLCVMLDENRYRYCDTMYVGAISTYIVATTLIVLAVVLRVFNIL